jgi:hypothetical protein
MRKLAAALVLSLPTMLFALGICQAQQGCWLGKNCCFIGYNSSKSPLYNAACDSRVMTGDNVLAQRGYPYIVFGPATFEEVMAYAIANGLFE